MQNQWVNPVALDAIAWRYYLVYVGVQIIIFAIIYFYFVETKYVHLVCCLGDTDIDCRGYTIEEVSRLLDGKAAAEAVSATQANVASDSLDHEKDKADIVHLDDGADGK